MSRSKITRRPERPTDLRARTLWEADRLTDEIVSAKRNAYDVMDGVLEHVDWSNFEPAVLKRVLATIIRSCPTNNLAELEEHMIFEHGCVLCSTDVIRGEELEHYDKLVMLVGEEKAVAVCKIIEANDTRGSTKKAEAA